MIDQSVKNNQVTFKNIRKIEDYYTIGCLLDYAYFRGN